MAEVVTEQILKSRGGPITITHNKQMRHSRYSSMLAAVRSKELVSCSWILLSLSNGSDQFYAVCLSSSIEFCIISTCVDTEYNDIAAPANICTSAMFAVDV